MAPDIVEVLGPHRCYWGLFCGSLAVELAKPPCANETVVDLHGDATNLARVLQDESLAVELYARLSRTLASETLFADSQAVRRQPWDEQEPDLDRAYHYFVASWLSRNGMAGTQSPDSSLAVRWTANGGSPAIRFRSSVESIPAWHTRLANILILRRDVFDVVERIEDEAATAIYADPPYLFETRKAKGHTMRSGGKYLHEFADADHVRLAVALSRFRKARVVVSYYADPRLAELYPGWRQVECARNKHLSLQSRRGARGDAAPEVLLVNDGPDVRPPVLKRKASDLFGATA